MILLRNVLHDGKKCNILIEGNKFKTIVPADVALQADEVIDCTDLAVLPAMYNTHNHAAMTLFRGYADDLPLYKWLNEYIWPAEEKLTPDDIQRGSRLAINEMIHSGTVFFNDMYFEIDRTIEEVDKSGMRACIGITLMAYHSDELVKSKLDMLRHWSDPTGGRIQIAIAPHAVYTINEERLRLARKVADEFDVPIHIHASETAEEVRNCIRDHGMTPIKYLDSCGILGPKTILAHCVHVQPDEWDIIAERQAIIAHCPSSNFKLGSGRFNYEAAISHGCRITLGTDGASSNNGLDLREEMRVAALMSKAVTPNADGTLCNTGEPTIAPATEVFKWGTRNGAEAFGIDAGVIEEGKIADCILVDLNNPKMQPCLNLISNWVYAADSSCISKIICNGKVLR